MAKIKNKNKRPQRQQNKLARRKPQRQSAILSTPQSTRLVRMRFSYHFGFSQTPTSGALPSTAIVKANGLYNPVSGYDHQPRGFDVFQNIFQNYVVLGSKMTTKFLYATASSTGDTTCCVGVVGQPNSVTYSTVRQFLEMDGCRHGIVSKERPTFTCVNYYSPRKAFNIVDPRDIQASYGGTYAQNPGSLYCWNVFHGGINDWARCGVQVECNVEFLVSWSNPRNIAESTLAS